MRAALVLAALLLAGCAQPQGPAPRSGTPHDPARDTAFGTLLSATREGELWNVTLDASAVACERNATRWSGLVRAAGLPAIGSEVGVRADDGSNVAGLWSDLASYAEACAPRHDGDVLLVGFESPEGVPGRTVRLRGLPVVLGASTLIGAQLQGMQDVPIPVELSNLSLREAKYPVGGREVCTVDPPHANLTLGALVGWTLPLRIDCPADAPPATPTRLSAIYGRLAFTDELGARHEREGSLWQFVYQGRDASLRVDAPGTLRPGEDLVVRAHYLDADGASIPAPQMRAEVDGESVEVREEGGAHVIRVPRIEAGEATVLVEAQDPAGGHVWREARVTVRVG